MRADERGELEAETPTVRAAARHFDGNPWGGRNADAVNWSMTHGERGAIAPAYPAGC